MFNTHIEVDVQRHVLVDSVLTPGQNTQKITVSDEPPALQTQDASVGQVTSGFKCSPSRNGAVLNTNTPNFAAPAYLDYTNPTTFGKITNTRDGQNDQREIQFALELYW